MPVFRVERNGNYTTMSNYHLQDRELSLKAKGLLSMCLSLTDSWDYSVNGLVAISKEGRTSVLSGLKELEQAGYIRREQKRGPDGKLGKIEYCIYEQRQPTDEDPWSGKTRSGNPTADHPTTDLPTSENPPSGNPPQLITKQLNTELINNEEKKEVRHRYGAYRNVLLSDEEMDKLRAEFPSDYGQRIERLSEYMASSGRTYKSHLATIRSWARRGDMSGKAGDASGGYHEKYRFREGESL